MKKIVVKFDENTVKNVKRFFFEQLFIILGTFLLSLSVNMFFAPNKLSGGGVTSIGTVLLYLFGIKMSVTNLLFNIVLFTLGYRHLGKYAVVKSASGIIFSSLFLEITSFLPVYKGEYLISAVIGGVIMGLGVGFTVRVGASTGGSDFAGLILKRFFPHISTANLILIIDCAIIIWTGVVFKSFEITVYSIIAMYISSKLTDMVVVFGDSAKSIHIFSEKNGLIAHCIMKEFERGVSGIHCTGMYSNEDRYMLLCVVTPKEVPHILQTIRRIDKSAFVVVEDALQVYGEGFKE